MDAFMDPLLFGPTAACDLMDFLLKDLVGGLELRCPDSVSSSSSTILRE